MKPFVSVIIPIYKVEAYLPKTIESCLAQTLRDIEIILVDDGSPDSCPALIDRYTCADTRIKAIHKTNEGVTLARKAGLSIAEGEYIFYLDGDDYLAPDALESLYYPAKEKDADFVVGDFIIEEPDGRHRDKKFYNFREADNLTFLRYCFREGDFYFTGRLILRNLIVNARLNIPSSITFGEDNVAVVQLAYKLRKAIKVNQPILYYVQREGSVTNILKKSDLKQRFNACNFVIGYARQKGFYDQMKTEIQIFALRQISIGLVGGYIDKGLANDYLTLPFNRNMYLKDNLDKKERFFLSLASVNLTGAICLFHFLKTIKRIFHHSYEK